MNQQQFKERTGSKPSKVEAKTNLAQYRNEITVQGKDGKYPGVVATFSALSNFEKNELYRLVKELGVLKEQVVSAIEESFRHTVIVLIYN